MAYGSGDVEQSYAAEVRIYRRAFAAIIKRLNLKAQTTTLTAEETAVGWEAYQALQDGKKV